MTDLDVLWTIFEFIERNAMLTIFLVSMTVVGFALYVVLQIVNRSKGSSR
jgi:hypothetical protein